MGKITSVKTVIDNNKIFTSQINQDDTRQFNEYVLTLEDIQSKELDFTLDVTQFDDKMEKISVDNTGNKFIGVDARNREVHSFNTSNPFTLNVLSKSGSYERPTRKVSLLGPDNNVVIPTTKPTLDWLKTNRADEYLLEISSDNFNTIEYSINVSGTTHTVAFDLNFDTTYQWRVAGVNKGGVGDFSTPKTFKTRIGNVSGVTLISPDSGDNMVPQLTTFNWSADPNAVSYRIQISSNNFASYAVNTTTFDTNYTASLVNDVTYKWRVQSINEFSTSAFSEVREFQVVSPSVGNVSSLNPINNSTGVLTSFTFTWGNAVNATSYDIQVSTNNFSTYVMNENVSTNSKPISGLSFNTTHQWRVRGRNRTNIGNWTTFSFVTRIGDVGSVILLSPSNSDNQVALSGSFDWTDANNATIYDIQISTNNFSTYVVNTTSSVSNYTYSGLSYNTTYQWRVRPRNAYSTGSYVTRTFTTRAANVGNVVLLSPSNGQQISSTSTTFDWSDASNATSYDFELYSGNYSSLITSTSRSSSSYTYSGLSLSTSYTWRVRGRNRSDVGNWSAFTMSVAAPTPTPTPTPVPTATPTPTPTPVPFLNLSRSSGSIGGSGGVISFSVSSNISWSVTDNRSWISISSASGSGSDSYVAINVSSNSSTSSRSGTVTVSGGGITRTISVSQSGVPVPTATPTPVPTATPTPTPTPTPDLSGNISVQYVVVAGGGSGGGSWNLEGGGGGGAGGYISSSTNGIKTNTLYNVTIGAGGSSVGYYTTGIVGNDTTFLTTAIGGGRGSGGAARALQASSGGSGGGSGGGRNSSVGGSGTPGQGYNGGGSGVGNNPGGGGGGADSAGQNGKLGGAGGSGAVNPITNTLLSKGGSGGVLYSGNGISGAANTGNGGDGSGTGSSARSGSGGSGVVILKYPSSYTISNPSGGLVISTSSSGGFKTSQITSGTGTIRFT